MNWLWEEPWTIGLLGFGAAALLAAVYRVVRARWLFTGAAVVLVATIGLLILERAVVTDREQVAQTLHQIAENLKRNDVSAVLAAIDPQALALRQRVERILGEVEVVEADIKSNLHVEILDPATRRRAVATFNAVGVVRDRTGQYGQQRLPYFFTVQFVRNQQQWLVQEYKMEDPRRGL